MGNKTSRESGSALRPLPRGPAPRGMDAAGPNPKWNRLKLKNSPQPFPAAIPGVNIFLSARSADKKKLNLSSKKPQKQLSLNPLLAASLLARINLPLI